MCDQCIVLCLIVFVVLYVSVSYLVLELSMMKIDLLYTCITKSGDENGSITDSI